MSLAYSPRLNKGRDTVRHLCTSRRQLHRAHHLPRLLDTARLRRLPREGHGLLVGPAHRELRRAVCEGRARAVEVQCDGEPRGGAARRDTAERQEGALDGERDLRGSGREAC